VHLQPLSRAHSDVLGRLGGVGPLEDDLVLHDPLLFVKLRWFTRQLGDDKVLQPNRFEVGRDASVHKAYVDGSLREHVIAKFCGQPDSRPLIGKALDAQIIFRQPLNPHSGCFFLNKQQMQHWTAQSYFLDRDTSFVGPLESAATLGILRTFRIYKPAAENANFLEIEHFGTRFLRQIRRE